MFKHLLVLFFAAAAWAQFPNALPMPGPEIQYLDQSGVPLAGAKLCTYVANTTTPLATFTDSTAGTANTNPVVLDSAGRASVWVGPVAYKFVLLVGGDGTCSTGVAQWTQDNVTATFSVGGAAGYVQYSAGGGLLAGDLNFAWNKALHLLTISALSNTSAGIAVANGYIESEEGFVASKFASPTTPLTFNAIQAPYGGLFGASVTAKTYVNLGSSTGPFSSNPPPLTSGDSYNAGMISYDLASACLSYFNGSIWQCTGSGGGGGGSPGGSTNYVQYNAMGTFGGNASFQWCATVAGACSATGLLFVQAASTSVAGIAVGLGFVQADQGFLATPATATQYNVVQATAGGMLARSVAASKYVSVGTSSGVPSLTSGDTLVAGHIYWDTGAAALQVYNGSAWVSLAGGSGSPGGSQNYVQVNSAGSFGASADFQWCLTAVGSCPATQLLFIQAASSSVPGLVVTTGYTQSDQGFLATTATATQYNVIQAVGGGVLAKSVGALNYHQLGNAAGPFSSAPPTLTAGDTFHAGAVSYDLSNACLSVYNGSVWACLGSGSGAVSSVNSLTGALTIAGTANEIIVTPSGTTITLTTPQAIGTASNVNFGTVTTTGVLNSNATGSAPALYVNSGTFQVNGNGAISSTNSATNALSIPNGGAVFNLLGINGAGNASQVRVSNTTTSNGVFLTNEGATGNISYGASFNGTAWIAAATSAEIMAMVSGEFVFSANTGLTPSSSYSPNTSAILTSAGNWSVAGTMTAASTISSTATGGTAALYVNGGTFEVNGAGFITGLAMTVSGNIITTGGTLQSNVTGSTAALYVNSGAFEVNGAGAILSTSTATNAISIPNGGAVFNLLGINGASGATQVRVSSNATTTDGLFLTGLGNSNGSFLSAGAKYTGSAWQATYTQAEVLDFGFGVSLYANTGLTIGSTFSPTITFAALATGITSYVPASFQQGLTTSAGTNSNITIGTGGAFYLFTTGASTGISCSGINDGWMGVTSDNYIVFCRGGSRFRAAYASF